jgi:hypothetical protein
MTNTQGKIRMFNWRGLGLHLVRTWPLFTSVSITFIAKLEDSDMVALGIVGVIGLASVSIVAIVFGRPVNMSYRQAKNKTVVEFRTKNSA